MLPGPFKILKETETLGNHKFGGKGFLTFRIR